MDPIRAANTGHGAIFVVWGRRLMGLVWPQFIDEGKPKSGNHPGPDSIAKMAPGQGDVGLVRRGAAGFLDQSVDC